MAVSEKQRKALRVALGAKQNASNVADAIADMIDSGANPLAANVAELGATAALSVVSGTYANGAEPTGAEVDATVQAVADEVEARLNDAEAKIDELLQSMVAAPIMES